MYVLHIAVLSCGVVEHFDVVIMVVLNYHLCSFMYLLKGNP